MEAPKLSSAHTTLCLSRSCENPRKYSIAGMENMSRSFREQGHKRLYQRRESSSADSDEVFDLSELQQSDDRQYLAYLQKLDTIDSMSDSSPTIDPVERKEVGSWWVFIKFKDVPCLSSIFFVIFSTLSGFIHFIALLVFAQ